MKPVIVLVGRPNVGKSTLFNRLLGTRTALVSDEPGVTRDRLYGPGIIGDRPYLVVDTGGLALWFGGDARDTLESKVAEQVWRAIAESDAVIFLVDARDGLQTGDREIAEALRRSAVQVWLAVNKAEGMNPELATAEFHALGAGEPVAVSAVRGDGVTALMQRVLAQLPRVSEETTPARVPVVAIVGRPNVGKSTLVNALLRQERMLVSEEPGTTRDSVHIPFRRGRRRYLLVDTAGVRRRARTSDSLERFSVLKTLQAVEEANVVLLVLDAQAGISEQDAVLAGMIVERGRGIVLAVNKWDGLDAAARRQVRRELDLKLGFLPFARTHFISALERRGLGPLFASVDRAFVSAGKALATPALNRVLRAALQSTPPPRARGAPVRLKFAHQGGRNPPVVIIHGNRVRTIPPSYRRYLANAVRNAFALEGTPVRVELREGENPYAHKGKSLAPGRRRRNSRRAARA